tara:strand:- start:3311 stop:5071 length:1761 start_codon:yes stop_codon:yes gene_type:complete
MDSYSRNKPSSNSVVDNEVARLLKKNKGVFDTSEFLKLRNKYDNQELVDKIQTAYLESYHKMVRRAKKFAHFIREKHGSGTPFSALLEKAHAYKKKAGLSDVEFAEFKRIYEQELAGTGSPEVLMPSTAIMRTLGAMPTGLTSAKMKVSPEDTAHMEQILKEHAANRPLHAQVLLQSIQYQDCDYEAMTGQYKRELGMRPGEHIHPVLAALFLPKMDYIDQTFLHSNIAGIVKSRYNDEPLVSRPDYELFYHLTMDPNDVVCSTKSPIADLKHRANVQHQLWNSVLQLRNGQYYNTSFREFITAVDMCKLNKHDNPDLVYGRYDGTVMKRLLAAFSFRPTVVATYQPMMPLAQNPYNTSNVPTVMSIQMINFRLPAPFRTGAIPPIDLEKATQQTQYFMVNTPSGTAIVPKLTDIIYSRGILVFYVDRRANVMRIPGVKPLNFHTFPTTLAGFERLNNRVVSFRNDLAIRDDKYTLRSVVVSEVNSSVQNATNQNIVVGSSALIRVPAAPKKSINADSHFHYHPYGVVDYVPVPSTGAVHNEPITQIHGTPGLGPVGESFTEMAQTRGCIFVYENTTNAFEGEIQT